MIARAAAAGAGSGRGGGALGQYITGHPLNLVGQPFLGIGYRFSHCLCNQEGSAYNGHFGCTCYHPLFVFSSATSNAALFVPATCTVPTSGEAFWCRYKIYPEGDVSKALARAAACQDDAYERMLLGKRPDFA